MADTDVVALLDIQDLDITLDQLRHRRESIPERLALAENEAALVRLDGELATLQERLGELQRSQRRLEDEIAAIGEKASHADRTLYSGTVANPRELQALQDEIQALGRRQGQLEDDVLDLMEASEPLAEEVARLEAARDQAGEEAARLRAVIAETEAEIDAETSAVSGQRDQAAARVSGELLETYEGLRRRLQGVAVARLESGRCTGCHLAVPATELDAIKRAPAGTVVRHEECGRILVRAA